MEMEEILPIKEIENGKFILRCNYCDGTGKEFDDMCDKIAQPCKVCNGKGIVLVDIDGILPFVKCKCCEGSGKGYDEDEDIECAICEGCKGLGVQLLSGDIIIHK
jgi:DnaJ-class molecular chaperone